MSGADDETMVRPKTPYERIGGVDPIRRMVDRFYDVMNDDPTYARLRSIHADDLNPMRDSLTGFLTGWMGGPRDWFGQGKCVMSAHSPFRIDTDLADQWLGAMGQAMDAEIDDAELRAMLNGGFEQMASAMVRD